MVIALIVVAVLLIALLALGFALASFSMTIRRQTLPEARAWQEKHYDLSWYDPLEKTDYTVRSFDGYELHAQLLKNSASSTRYVIISHGITDNRFGALKYARFYLKLGFNAIIYDLRGHGENETAFCSYSIREGRDLCALISDARTRFRDVSVLGIHGESLGAATTVACLKAHPQVDFAVADCGFSEITTILQSGLSGMHMPPFLVHVASFCAKLRYGFFFHEMRPIDSLAENDVPILFIHGAEDSFIPPRHSEAMAKATRGYSEVRLIPGAGHAASALTAPELYQEYLKAFLEKVLGTDGAN